MFWPHAFSRAWRQLHVFVLDSDGLGVLFTSVAIGLSNYSGFGFTTLNWKLLYYAKNVKDDKIFLSAKFRFTDIHFVEGFSFLE